jgi:hypothetical protein
MNTSAARGPVKILWLLSLRAIFLVSGTLTLGACGSGSSTPVSPMMGGGFQPGPPGVAENVTARALGVKPQLRVIAGGQRDVRQPLDDATDKTERRVASR